MIELNKEQADKLCEIVNVKFDHFNSAQYQESTYNNDTEPQYYFWSVPIGRSSFKINRITGEMRFDDLYENTINIQSELLSMLEESGIEDDRSKESKKIVENHLNLKIKVKEYLISENLL